jgi:beta-phosphoglucomutase-like phosphatase (HAD superfamily)
MKAGPLRARYFDDPALDALLARRGLVVFDVNGLIVDDERAQLESALRVLGPYGILIDEERWELTCVGRRADVFFASLLAESGISPDGNLVGRLVREKNEAYRKIVSLSIRGLVRPGVHDILDHIKNSPGQRAAIATSALPDELDAIIGREGLDIAAQFDYIATGADIKKTKPDPEIYLLLSNASKTAPRDCLVFEDSGAGVEAASNAGMTCAAVPNGFTRNHDFGRASFVIDSLRRDARILPKPRRLL